MSQYNFEKACNLDQLKREIEASSIVTGISYISGYAQSVEIVFKATLSSNDEQTLNNIVNSHIPNDTTEAILVEISNAIDPDTGGVRLTPKFAPDGWHQQYFETEFETSKPNSIHEKDWKNVDIGFSSLKFYDDEDNELVQGELSNEDYQALLNTACVRTDLSWMPDHDYAIKSGFIAQRVVPEDNVYIWALGVDLPEAYGGPQACFAEGGLNLIYVDARTRAGLDGVSPTIMYYSHPQLGDGMGTNRIRFVVRHPAGYKHRLQAVMEIFVPQGV
jgi:hypothetical protein